MICPSKSSQKRKLPNIECEQPVKKKMAWDSYNSIEDFGYRFNEEGRLVRIEDNEAGFNFYVSDDHSYNQKNYENLGEVVTEYVYELLQSEEVGLEKLEIPVTKESSSFLPNIKKQQNKGGAKGFIFVSKDYLSKDKLLILVHGSGVVRAGQWARSLIINDCLDHGTQIPYIKRAIKDGYGVVVTNTNQNDAYVDVKGEKVWKQIKKSESPEKHFSYVWKNIIEKTSASRIFVVAHSYGGYLVVDYFSRFPKILQRVVAVAFTDSVHSFSRFHSNSETRKWFVKNSVNWVTSDQDLGTPILHQDDEKHVRRISAGTTKHAETSWKAIDAVFDYFQIQDSEFDNIKEHSKNSGKSDRQEGNEGGNTKDSSDQQNVIGEGSLEDSLDPAASKGKSAQDVATNNRNHEEETSDGKPKDSSGQQETSGGDHDSSDQHEVTAREGTSDSKPKDSSGQQETTSGGDHDDSSDQHEVTSREETSDSKPKDSSGEQGTTSGGDHDDSSDQHGVTSREETSDGKPKDSSGQQETSGGYHDDSSDQHGVTAREGTSNNNTSKDSSGEQGTTTSGGEDDQATRDEMKSNNQNETLSTNTGDTTIEGTSSSTGQNN